MRKKKVKSTARRGKDFENVDIGLVMFFLNVGSSCSTCTLQVGLHPSIYGWQWED